MTMGWFMSSAARNAPMFAWLGPLSGLAEFGTGGYPRAVRRRLKIVNAMAVLIALFSASMPSCSPSTAWPYICS